MNKLKDINNQELTALIMGMRAAYLQGGNAMKYAREHSGIDLNSDVGTLVAYDLQAGSYTRDVIKNPKNIELWCRQLAGILNPFVKDSSSILEVGCGEATTLAGVLEFLDEVPVALGFDISWSRCAYGMKWLARSQKRAGLFVGDLFNIPLEDSSIDVVYTSHSLEPNGGREHAALQELIRVARHAVILVEPLYELASDLAKQRMSEHGYVKNLRITAEKLGATVTDYRLLSYCVKPLNPSGVVLIEKGSSKGEADGSIRWRCPLTSTPLRAYESGYFSSETGVVYPVLSGIPLLRTVHAVVGSAFETFNSDGWDPEM